MKTNLFPGLAACIAIAGTLTLTSTASAQDSKTPAQANSTSPVQITAQTDTASPASADSSPTIVQAVPVGAPAPQLAYGVSQIVQLSQAKVDENTIIAYIKNSGNSYRLSADQIIYLRQQGVSTGVINAMLIQPAPGVMTAGASVPLPSGPAPQVNYTQPAAQSTGVVGPSVTAIDPTAAAAANYYYYQPYYYPYYSYPYYPSYSYYPGVSVSLGWSTHWGTGWGGWHGGGGGWHGGGGGFHGGWHH